MNDKLGLLRRNSPGESQKQQTSPSVRPLSRRRLTILLSWLAAFAFAGALIALFGDRLMPAFKVETETVVTLSREASDVSGMDLQIAGVQTDPYSAEALFRASGWFEADPYPHRATALVGGVVEAVEVLEGELVSEGQVLATLIREDAEIEVARANGTVQAASASLASSKASRKRAEFQLETLGNELLVAESRLEELEDLARRARDLGSEVIPKETIVQTRLRVQTQERRVDTLRSRIREQEAELMRLKSEIARSEGNLAVAEASLAEARLALGRTAIRSPIDGIVQRLMAAPGQKKLLMSEMPESATIAILYDPDSMQARIDVPLSEAGRVFIGQAVLLESEFLPGKSLKGRVTRIVGEADLQRNTLQVKVAIEQPTAGLRPDILCRAEFLASRRGSVAERPDMPGTGSRTRPSGDLLMVLVPESALVETAGQEVIVWVVDETGRRAERREVTLTGEDREGYRVVRGGLLPGDRVILSGHRNMREGKRITY